MHGLLTLLEQLPPLLIYLVAAMLVATETAFIVGLVLPAEATLLLVGFLAYAGTLRLFPALLLMIAAAVTGDALAWRAGRRHGPRIRGSRLGRRVGEHRWDRAHAMLHRLDGRGILGARWVAFARTLVPRLAGSAGMPYGRFARWNAAGVVSWVGASVLVGYLAGTSYERVSQVLGRATGAGLALAGCVLAIVIVGRWLGRNPDPARALLARARRLPMPRRPAPPPRGERGSPLRRRPRWAGALSFVGGLGVLFAGGVALVWLVDSVLRYSGLSGLDAAVARFMTDLAASDVDAAATAIVSTVRGSVLVLVVALVAVVLGSRPRARRAALDGGPAGRVDLIGLLGTVGAFLPLVLLALAAELLPRLGSAPPAGVRIPPLLGANPVVTASLCTLAWLLARYAGRPWAIMAWSGAAVGVTVVIGARLYLGWTNASEAVTSVLLGVLWTAVFMVAWSTRSRTAMTDNGGEVTVTR